MEMVKYLLFEAIHFLMHMLTSGRASVLWSGTCRSIKLKHYPTASGSNVYSLWNTILSLGGRDGRIPPLVKEVDKLSICNLDSKVGWDFLWAKDAKR